MTYSKVGVIIPSLSRPKNLLRQLKFYNHLKANFDIYICDSTPILNYKFLDEINFLSKSLTINYFHEPNLNDIEAIHFLISKCNSAYTAYIADDDFFLPEGIFKSVDFLEENKGYRVAYGQAIIVNQESLFNPSSRIVISPYWGKPIFNQDNFLERLNSYSKNYFVPQFGVHRTTEFLEDFSPCSKLKSRSMSEYLSNYLTILRGKAMFLPIPYLIRQTHSERYCMPSHFVDILVDDSFGEALPIFIKNMSKTFKELGTESSESNSLAKKYAKSILFNLFNKSLKQQTKNNSIIPFYAYINYLYRRVFFSFRNIYFRSSTYLSGFQKYLEIIQFLE
tara:strand:+ start:5891 stop:6898 length:1008 start_codon:yes stop_codon:yes gene_type:complete